MAYGMNPQRAKHMGQEHSGHEAPKEPPAEHETHGGAEHHAPSIHIHSHAKGHTVHIMHPSGAHEQHEHASGDAEGIASHIHEHIGGEPGQDHGGSSGNDMEDEYGLGGSGV